MADFDPNGPHGYVAPLVCPIPGEESDGHSGDEASSPVPANPVIQAVLSQDVAALEECLDRGRGDVNAPIDDGGWTALHFAVRFSNADLCRALLGRGADVGACDAVERWTPLHVAAMTSEIAPEMLELLLEHALRDNGSAAHRTDVRGRTALHLCFLSACKKLAEAELNGLMDQRVMDDFHYFALRAGDWSIRNTVAKKPALDDGGVADESDDARDADADPLALPVSDSQNTLSETLQNSPSPNDSDGSVERYNIDTSTLVPALNNHGTSTSDGSADREQNDDPDMSSEAVESDDSGRRGSRGLPLELPDDVDSTEEPPSQISIPLYTIPEGEAMEMTARYVTTTLTFQSSNDERGVDYGSERFDYESDDSSIEECVAVLEAFDLSSDDERTAARQQDDQSQLSVIHEKIRLLLANGFQIRARDNRGDTVLHYAAWIDNTEIFESVAACTADAELCAIANYEGQTVLHMAALSGCPHVIRILLRKGSDLNLLDQHRNSPADMFIMEHFRKRDRMITPWLRSKESQSKYNIDVCLDVLREFSDYGCVVSNIATMDHLLNNAPLDKVEELVTKKPKLLDFDARNFQQQTLIHVASLRKYEDEQVGLVSLMIGFLIDNGVVVDEKDVNGRTPLLLACWQRNKAIVKTLLTHGADTRLCDKFGQGCLHYAVMEMSETLPNWSSFSAFQAALARLADGSHPRKLVECQLDILELLLAHGADLRQADCHGRTALHRAVTDSDKDVVAFVTSRGGDLGAPDANGLSPSVYIVKLHRNDLFHLTFSPEKGAKMCFDNCKDLPPFRRPLIPAIEEQPVNNDFDVLEQVRRMRGDLDKFTKKLLTTPGIGHVLFEGENASIRAEVFLLMQRLSSALGDIDQRLASSVHIAGSVREDTKVGQPNGFDYIFELINLKSAFELRDAPRCSGGDAAHRASHVSLKLKDSVRHDPVMSSFCDSQGTLHGSVLASVFGSAVLRVLSRSSTWSDLKFIWEDDMELGSNFVTFPCMIQLRWMGPKYRELLVNIDIVPAIFVSNTGMTNISKCASPLGSTVLIKWDGDLSNDCNLQLSFFDAESQVFHNVPSIVKDGYRLAKTVATTGLCQQEGSGVNALLLKTVLFWLLYPDGDVNENPDFSWITPISDQIPVTQPLQKWTEIRWVAYHLYDRLESHLFTEYLASFFLPPENLLSFTASNLDQMIDMCMAAKALLSDPD